MMLMKIVPAALGLALSTCPFGGEAPGGYAHLEGTVRHTDGDPYHGGIFVACGEHGREARTDSRGRYAVEYEVGGVPFGAELSAEGEFMVPCRVNAPANQPPFAMEHEMVPFNRERGRRATTRIDLLEGRMEPDPDPEQAP